MKILLTTLNSKFIHSNLALRYLYEAAAEYRSSLVLQEFTINQEEDHIYLEILRGGYDAVCFSCYIWNRDKTLQLADNLKKAKPGLAILAGGPELSIEPVKAMTEHKSLDFVIEGEGERPFFLWLAQMHQSSPDFQQIPGLSWRSAGKLCSNPPAPPLPMTEIPFPYEHRDPDPDKLVYYETSRGCPFRCSYCLSSLSKGIRSLPLETVKLQLTRLLQWKLPQIKLVDRTFNWDRARCEEIVDFLIDQDNGVTNFHLELCGDLIDPPLISLLGRARKGLFQLEIGVQSTNPRVLEVVSRVCDFPVLARNVERIRELGTAHLHLDLIAGLPHEDLASFRNSFNDVYRIQPDHLQLGFLKMLHGSGIREQAQEFGYLYRKKPPYEVISNRDLSATEIVLLKMIENVLDLYYNRGGFPRTLQALTSRSSWTPFDCYRALALYYYESGFQHRSHSKEDLYRILRNFLEESKDLSQEEKDKALHLLLADREAHLHPDAIHKFDKKGWEIQKEN